MDIKRTESYGEWLEKGKEADVSQLASLASKLSSLAREELLASIEEDLVRKDTVMQEEIRIALVKLLIAMVPDSWPAIRRFIVEREQTGLDAEVRFTLFCFLDVFPCIVANRRFLLEAACLVGEFMRNAKTNSARATWMAGDLLGDHWDPVEAVPILLDVLVTGKYVEGRLSAIHGLEHAIRNVDCSDALKESISRGIALAATNDRSQRIRECAQRSCDCKGVCSATEIS